MFKLLRRRQYSRVISAAEANDDPPVFAQAKVKALISLRQTLDLISSVNLGLPTAQKSSSAWRVFARMYSFGNCKRVTNGMFEDFLGRWAPQIN